MSFEDNKTVELVDEIYYQDLLSTGARFRINFDSMAETIDQDIFDEAGSGDDDDDDELDEDSKLSPWKKSFNELIPLMVAVPNDYGTVYKRIIIDGIDEAIGSRNCRFQWTYNMFFERDDKAFDSSVKPNAQEKSGLLPGLLVAVESMCAQEEAHFIIDYKLMFGEMGCPPRIKPKANVLLVAKLNRFEDIGDENACDNLTNEERKKFQILKEKVIEMQKKSLDHFKYKRYRYAISVGQSAIKNLEFCTVANESEQKEQQKLVIELYSHLSDCYVKTQDWKKTCLMVNELRRRTDISRNVGIMLNEAIALSHIEDDDYKRSIGILRKAQQIEPHNELVNRTLAEVLAKAEKYKKEITAIWKKALDLKAEVDNESQ